VVRCTPDIVIVHSDDSGVEESFAPAASYPALLTGFLGSNANAEPTDGFIDVPAQSRVRAG
jgi:hypothetical protein